MLVFILGYAVLLAGLGLWLSRRVRASADFFVAGRDLSPGLLFATLLAANLGAGSTVGAAELGYRIGLSAWWWVGSAGLGSLVLAFAIGPHIYRVARERDLFTVGDWLELRYDARVRWTAAALLWAGSLAILAGQLIAMGFVLDVAAGLPPAWGCALGGFIVTIYFTAGGLRGSAWINLLQVVVKVAGFCLAAWWTLDSAGGWDGLVERARAAGAAGGYGSPVGVGPARVLGYAALLIPSFFLSPGLIQKLFGARDEAAVRAGTGWQAGALLLYAFLPVTLGMAAFTQWPALENPGLALPQLLAEGLPPWLGGLMLAAIFSAEISSADAVLFMLSTSFARDFYQRVVDRDLDDRALLRTARLTAVAAGAAGVGIAVALQSVLAALTLFYTLLTVTLFAPLVFGLASKRGGAGAALGSILCAVPVTLGVHLATDGAGFGLLNPPLCGIVAGAAAFAVARRGPNNAETE